MSVCASELVQDARVPGEQPASSSAPSNSACFSQRSELCQLAAAANPTLPPESGRTAMQAVIAREYNRLGGLFSRLARLLQIPVTAALAVWFVESSGAAFVASKALIRFEVHHFWTAWGRSNPSQFDPHFCFGGHGAVPGHPWENHALRVATDGAFAPLHQGQAQEYAALKLATELAGQEIAVQCISIGGCQLLGCDYRMLGYASAVAMYRAFQSSENAHVMGFFDFCAHQPAPHAGDLLEHLRRQDFASFARYYNGSGAVEQYAKRLTSAAQAAKALLEPVSGEAIAGTAGESASAAAVTLRG